MRPDAGGGQDDRMTGWRPHWPRERAEPCLRPSQTSIPAPSICGILKSVDPPIVAFRWKYGQGTTCPSDFVGGTPARTPLMPRRSLASSRICCGSISYSREFALPGRASAMVSKYSFAEVAASQAQALYS